MYSAESSDADQPKTLDGLSTPENSSGSDGRESRPTLKRRRMSPRDGSPPLALVYNAGNPKLGVEEINEENKKSNSFEIQLPRWRNEVDVFIDMDERRGYTATIRLNRLGAKKNWQRHLGMNYQVLFVKGHKPTFPY